MKKTRLICSLFLTFTVLFGQSASASLEEDLKKILNSYRIPNDRLGLYVVDLGQPKHPTIMNVNGDKNMIPASLSKVVTATGVLQKFGPSYKFETDLLSDAPREGATLKGPVYLKGGGDPGFVSESMWILVNEFYRSGIKEITGDLVVDESAFDAVRFDESRDPERVDRAYDAPVGAMSFNWNSVNVFIRPTTVGQAPAVFLDPEMKGMNLVNRAKTVKDGKPDIRVSRGEDDAIFVEGKMPMTTPEVVVYKSITEPAIYSGQALRAFLAQRGISVKGTIRTGKTPAEAHLMAKVEGKPVSSLVADMMKFSNNYVAEMLTKNLGAKFLKQPARLEDGVDVIRNALIEMGLKKEHFQFVNPSGLSRHNSFRAIDLAFLLTENYKRFSYAPEYLTAMPLSGVDGTLKSRFKNSNAEGLIRAKTGHLNGVAGLAGFAGQKDGNVFAFAFMFNGPADQGDLARRLFDALASKLVQ
jgi:D-alanyl-D-alanine carboxypeptidase/D-alanyl-D-alanine-endopeptidase (penicillin-binding protein 4)